MSKVVFGEKVGAKFMSFMVGKEDKELHSAWYTLVEANGQMVTVKDADSPVGLMEAESRYKAIKKGKEFLSRMKAREEEAAE